VEINFSALLFLRANSTKIEIAMDKLQTITEKECQFCLDKKTGQPYRWVPRILGRPKQCPNCHNPNWDKGRVSTCGPKPGSGKVRILRRD
jgi:hypothetical protein